MSIQKPTVIKDFMKKNNKYTRPGTTRSKTTKIAWHYTGEHDVAAANTVSYFKNVVANGYIVNGKYIYASSHYVCGLKGEIYYIIPEEEIAYTTNAANSYSIGIECATTGSNDHYSDAEYISMVKLGAYLANKYNLDPKKDFIRHYDITGKICPRYFVNNKSKWEQFKLDCYNLLHGKISEKDIINCTNGKGKVTTVPNDKTQYLRIIADKVNAHVTPDFNSDSVCEVLSKDTALTIIEKIEREGTDMYKVKPGYYVTSSTKYVEVFER